MGQRTPVCLLWTLCDIVQSIPRTGTEPGGLRAKDRKPARPLSLQKRTGSERLCGIMRLFPSM